jgi:hypothetical protein
MANDVNNFRLPGQFQNYVKDYINNPKLGMSIDDVSKGETGYKLSPAATDATIKTNIKNKNSISKSISQPKVESSLISEAKKYKSAEEFVFNKKTTAVKNNIKDNVLTNDIVLYHGKGGSLRANETFVRGKYFTPSVEDALKYARDGIKDIDVTTIKKGAKIFDLDLLKNPNQKIVPVDVLYSPKDLSKYLQDKGYVATRNSNLGFEEIVRLDNRTNSKWFKNISGDKNIEIDESFKNAPDWMKEGNIKMKTVQELIKTNQKTELTKSQLTDIWNKANGKK